MSGQEIGTQILFPKYVLLALRQVEQEPRNHRPHRCKGGQDQMHNADNLRKVQRPEIIRNQRGGRLLAGATGDRYDPRYLLAGGLAIELVGVVMLNYTETPSMVYAYATMFGVGNGATIVALPALVANYFGALHFAKIIGVVHLILTPFAAIA